MQNQVQGHVIIIRNSLKDPTKQPVVVDGSEEEEDEEADGLSFFAFFSRETSVSERKDKHI